MASPASLSREADAFPKLNLTPRSFARHLHVSSPELYDPNPDWSLQDLKDELDALASKLSRTPTFPKERSPSPHAVTSCSFSWRELSVAADFGRARRPFRISAFDEDSDGEEDDLQQQTEVQQRENLSHTNVIDQNRVVDNRHSSSSGVSHVAVNDTDPWLLPRTEISEGLMFELERERLQRVQEEVRQRRFVLEIAIEEESIRSAAIFEQVDKEEESKRELARRIDKQYQRSIAEVRDTHLSALQREHEQRSQVEERKIRREAEARKREVLAREERERQEKLKAEAEAKRKADAKLFAEAERKRQAEAAAAAALQRAEMERLAKESMEHAVQEQARTENSSLAATSDVRRTSDPKPKVSETAAKLEHTRSMKLVTLLELSQSVQMNANMKKVLKDHERSLTKFLQQVSATQEQVRIKSMNLINELASSPYQAFSITTFASKLMSQCEIQVSKLPSFAFALAQVVVNISSRIPEVMELVIAKLNEVCIFTVPKYYVFRKSQFENDRAYYKALGYNEEGGKLESTDDYAARMNAYVTLYAAITQADIDGGANPHGLKEGWAWCARLLNTFPADRLTASALEAFLKVAGFKLCRVYKRSFMKMLHAISTEFVGSLRQQNDPDSRAVVSRLETYIGTEQFLQTPDGLHMPKSDLSSTLKC